MKTHRTAMALIAVMMLTSATPVFAAMPEDTTIDRVGDWFATIGKSEQDKARVLSQRHNRRASKRFDHRRWQRSAQATHHKPSHPGR